MPIKICIDITKKRITSKIIGDINDIDAKLCIDEINAHPDFDNSFDRLIDFRKIGKNKMSADGIRMAAHISDYGPKTKVAFVVDRDIEKGNANMFIRNTSYEVNNFFVTESYEDALAWLEGRLETEAEVED